MKAAGGAPAAATIADPDNFYYALLDPGIPITDVPNGQDWVSFDAENFNTLDVAAWANTDFMKLARKVQRTTTPNT